jgi:hypothetical protein
MWSPVGRDAIPSSGKMGWSVLKHDWYSTPLIHVNMADIFRIVMMELKLDKGTQHAYIISLSCQHTRSLHDTPNVTLVSMWINLWDLIFLKLKQLKS